MNFDFLDFEQPIAELQAKIDQLHYVSSDENSVDIVDEIEKLEAKCNELTKKIFSKLTAGQISQLSRHSQRPYALDYIKAIFTDFQELHGDRAFADDKAIIGGLARLEGESVVIIGQEKGRGTNEKVKHNFGMARPEGYRKAKRLMELGEKFKIPIITLIDTPGAYPGVGAEERGQSESIARNLYLMSKLKTPIIATVIGEGGSGGALAIAVADKVNMLEYSIYSVISPEGCSAILWRNAKNAKEAAEALGITANRLLELKLIDEVIKEPLGGAHRNHQQATEYLKQTLVKNMKDLKNRSIESIVSARYNKLISYGNFTD